MREQGIKLVMIMQVLDPQSHICQNGSRKIT